MPGQPRSDFVCVWKSFRCSDPKLWPPMRDGLQGSQRSEFIAHTARAPLDQMDNTVLGRPA